MPRMTFAELNTALNDSIAAGKIYNVDFQEWKTYHASRSLEDAIDVIRADFMHVGKYQDRTNEELAVIDALTDSIVQFPTKRCTNALDTLLELAGCENPVFLAVDELIGTWGTIGDKFRTLKPMIVKGRKPQTSTTPERTLDNTGTCACCGKNVKMDTSGNIVAHGYTIRHGYQQNACYGFGFPPIEISDIGVRAYRKSLAELLLKTVNTKQYVINSKCDLPSGNAKSGTFRMVSSDEDRYQKLYDSKLMAYDGDIRFFAKGVKSCDSIIENWVAKPLPGMMAA